MQITLLPPLLPTDGVTSVPTASAAFTPGARLEATVLSTGRAGGTLLSLAGREMPARGHLPYPPGTTLRLEVVQGGAQPLLRLVSVDGAVGAAPGSTVSASTYGLAAAVLAARPGHDVRADALAVARWMPALMSRGLVNGAQADAMLKVLGPVPVPVDPAGASTGAGAGAAARAIADHVGGGGLLLERRLADVVRHGGPAATTAAAGDLRSRLAVVVDLLQGAPPGLAGARDALQGLQQALLAEQARVAAHLASAGVVDVRVPLRVDGREAETPLRMRIGREAPEPGGDDDPTPWRQVRLDLTVEGLGRVQVRLGARAAEVRAEFLVEDPASADRIEAGLADLVTALEGAGFAQVLSRVVVDPVTVCAPDALPALPTAGILDARA